MSIKKTLLYFLVTLVGISFSSHAQIITTIAGDGITSHTGKGRTATNAAYHNGASSIVADTNSDIYFSEVLGRGMGDVFTPVSLIMGLPSVCVGATILMTDTIIGGRWSSSDTLIAKVDSNTGLVTGINAGSATITYSYGSLFDTATLSVNSLPFAGTIKGPDSICAWAPHTYIDTTPGGLWGVANLNAFVDSFGKFTGTTKGFDSLFYTISNSCGTDTAFKKIYIKAYPSAGYISGYSSVCLGDSIVLTDTFGIALWINVNNKGSFTPFNNDSILFQSLKVGADTIMAVKYTSCGNDTARKVILINALPNAGTIFGFNSVCVDQTVQFFDTLPNGRWSAFNKNVSLAGNVYVTGNIPGIDTIMYKVTNSCGVDSTIWQVTVLPLPEVPTITRNKNTLTVPTGYSMYQWTQNGIPIAGATTNSYTVTQVGSYWVQVNNQFYCMASSPPQTITNFECSPDDIRVFPSPASTMIYIDWCLPVRAKLMSIDGKTVVDLKNINQIDIGYLPNGIYQLSLFDTEGQEVKTGRITKLQ